MARCFALIHTNARHEIEASLDAPPSTALGPADIQNAYRLPATGGGQTVAVVDAGGYSAAESDLAAYRSYYGLPPCTTANGCFRKVDQRGGTSYPQDDTGWAEETALDIDAVSAACPACNIMLVEGDDASVDSLGSAVDTAVALGAKYVSNSYGIYGELPNETELDHYYDHPGVAVTASTGDDGYLTNYPSASPNVVAVGGTTLTRNAASARGWDETVWAGTGSGCSPYEPQPDFQTAVTTGCAQRATGDIAADADPQTGLAVYDTLDPPGSSPGWLQVGGTSLSSPLVAAMYALAGAPADGTYPVTYPYHDANQGSDLFDVTQGSNGTCGNVLCTAGAGWDGPTGLGTPNGVTALALGPHGDITGQVSNTDTGQPVAGASVTAEPGGYGMRTDSTGHYHLTAKAGTYTLTAMAYGYAATTLTAQITEGQTTTVDLPLTPVPSNTLSGQITDGSGHGWPVYAQISIDGYNGAPLFTDPYTGRYSVTLPDQASYTMHVSTPYPGYTPATSTVAIGSSDVAKNIALAVDTTSCTAPGYDWNGQTTTFAGWSGVTPNDGWTVSDATGSGQTWRFDNPGNRPEPPGGDDHFAIADSALYGTHGRQNTTLTSPPVDLSGQTSPELDFDTAYYGAPRGQTASVDLSTNGGATWSTVWQQTTATAAGGVHIPIPAAAGKPGVRVRFHYTGNNDWWWAIDNVFLGTRTCVPTPGGLLTGQVSNPTGAPLPGATIADTTNPDRYGVAIATPDDTGLGDGFYWLFTTTGTGTFTAARTGYASTTGSATITADQVTRHDWTLTPDGS